MKIAGNGTGDTRWKVPGMLDWSTMRHNPFVEVTKDTTTLYASDRDVFLFLVDDMSPIEAGRLPKIGRAHVCTPVTNAHLVCRLLLEQTNKTVEYRKHTPLNASHK